MKKIPLSKGQVAIVDDDRHTELTQFKWCVTSAKRNGFYAVRAASRTEGTGKRLELMHRRIMGLPALSETPGVYVDHVNGNGLDNRRSNLRLCSNSQNAHAGCLRPNQFGFRGICRDGTKYVAQLKLNYRRIYCGRFDDLEAAARAYDSAARRYFGEFARLNFPTSTEVSAHAL